MVRICGTSNSLDAFTVLVEMAACRAGRAIEVIRRSPFLAGDEPAMVALRDRVRAAVDRACLHRFSDGRDDLIERRLQTGGRGGERGQQRFSLRETEAN